MKATPNYSKKFFLFFVVIVTVIMTTLPALAQRGDDTNRLSKNGKTEGVVDGVEIVLEYGRPKVKGREIWGGLVPYDKVWRTGANEATTISFSADVMIEGKTLPKGKYALFTIPGVEKWIIILNKTAKQSGAFGYDESQDALRVEVVPESGAHVEEMTFIIEDSSIVLVWEKLRISIDIAAVTSLLGSEIPKT
jgi:hypothetical protein